MFAPTAGMKNRCLAVVAAHKWQTDYEVELLGALPLDLRIREQTDSGNPSVIAEPDESPANAYRATARRMAARLALQGKDYSRRFPNIVVENQ